MSTIKSDTALMELFKRTYAPHVVSAFTFEMGPPPPPLTRWRAFYRRVRSTNYRMRVWLAVNVLRLRMESDE